MLNAPRVIRSAAVAVIAAAVFLGTTQTANAVPPSKLTDLLAELWTTVLETPSAENPFGTGGADDACWDLGADIVAPFGPVGVESCTVKPDTRIFVAASSVECSTFEGTSEADLEECAECSAMDEPTVTLDGRPVSLQEAITDVTPATLPAGNLFDLPEGTEGQFAAHGWVALLYPLTPGTHTIEITNGTTVTTTIIVEPGRT